MLENRTHIIIGSSALNYYFPEYEREAKDLDVAIPEETTRPRIVSEKRIEYLVNPVLFKYSNEKYLNPDLLLTLKMSHLFWDINWDKHLFHVQFLLSKGAVCNVEVFNELYEYWNILHGQNKRSDLTMSADDFFDNALKEYDHDYLHTLLKPEPTYVGMLADGAEVEIDEKKFQGASREDKEGLVREEVYVMAFERFQKLGYRRAYNRMLKKYIIGHAPLYVARFVMENYIELHRPDIDFIKVIGEAYDRETKR